MSAVTYKCPNCGGGLSFNPTEQKLACEFCLSFFTDDEISLIYTELEKTAQTQEFEQQVSDEKSDHPAEEINFHSHTDVYKCNNCGAEILADDTTAATVCFYCHNPVMFSGRFEGASCPAKIVPFGFDRETAKRNFLNWARKKRFVPNDFFCEEQIAHIAGVYYPFWLTDSDVFARLTAVCRNVRHWTSGEYTYTETSTYHVVREGAIHFEDIVSSALKKADKNLLNGILPFPVSTVKEFSMRLLSGFLAEQRDVEKEDVKKDTDEKIVRYAEKMLKDTIGGYSSVFVQNSSCDIRNCHWDYTLMPVWILTYIDKKSGKRYTYALNGQTKSTYGELPVSVGKLIALFAGVASAIFALLTVTGGFLF